MARLPHIERSEPRISANDLAQYMVSSDTARMGIVRRAKFPQVPPITRYRDARTAVCAYLAQGLRSAQPLVAAENTLRQRLDDPATGTLARDDAQHSIEVLHAIQTMQNQLAAFQFQPAPTHQDKLSLGGVEVSVRADLIVLGQSRGVEQVGLAVLRMTVDDADTLSAIERRRSMGLYVATLARMHLDANMDTNRSPVNRLCMSIDVQHGEVFAAPNSNTRRQNDLENACRMIAAIWPQISN